MVVIKVSYEGEEVGIHVGPGMSKEGFRAAIERAFPRTTPTALIASNGIDIVPFDVVVAYPETCGASSFELLVDVSEDESEESEDDGSSDSSEPDGSKVVPSPTKGGEFFEGTDESLDDSFQRMDHELLERAWALVPMGRIGLVELGVLRSAVLSRSLVRVWMRFCATGDEEELNNDLCDYAAEMLEPAAEVINDPIKIIDEAAQGLVAAGAITDAHYDQLAQAVSRGDGSIARAYADAILPGSVQPDAARLRQRLVEWCNESVREESVVVSLLRAMYQNHGIDLNLDEVARKGALTRAQTRRLATLFTDNNSDVVAALRLCARDGNLATLSGRLVALARSSVKAPMRGAPRAVAEPDSDSDSDYVPSSDEGSEVDSDEMRAAAAEEKPSDDDEAEMRRQNILWSFAQLMRSDGQITPNELNVLERLIESRDCYVFAALEVYEADDGLPDREEELRDTLARVSRFAVERLTSDVDGGAGVGGGESGEDDDDSDEDPEYGEGSTDSDDITEGGYPKKQLNMLVGALSRAGVLHRNEAISARAAITLRMPNIADAYRFYHDARDEDAAQEEFAFKALQAEVLSTVRPGYSKQIQEQAARAAAAREGAAGSGEEKHGDDGDDGDGDDGEWEGENLPDLSNAETETAIGAANGHLAMIMQREGVITAADAQTLRRLFNAHDPVVRAAWALYIRNRDQEHLRDTLQRVAERERSEDRKSKEHVDRVVAQLVTEGRLSTAEGSALGELMKTPDEAHLVEAAMESFHSNGDVNDLRDTLKVIAEERSPAGLEEGAFGSKDDPSDPTSSVPDSGDGETMEPVAWLLDMIGLMKRRDVIDANEAAALNDLATAGDPRILAVADLYENERNAGDALDTLRRIGQLATADPSFVAKYADLEDEDEEDADEEDADEEDGDGEAKEDAPQEMAMWEKSSLLVVSVLSNAEPFDDGTPQFSPHMIETLRRLAINGYPAIIAAVREFGVNHDEEDFLDTLARVYVQFSEGDMDDDGDDDEDDDDDDDVIDESLYDALLAVVNNDELSVDHWATLDDLIDSMQLPRSHSRRLADAIAQRDPNVVSAALAHFEMNDVEELKDTLRRVAALAARGATRSAGGASEEKDDKPQIDVEKLDPEEQRKLAVRLLTDLAEDGDLTAMQLAKLLKRQRQNDVVLSSALAVYFGEDTPDKADLIETLVLLAGADD